MPSPTSTRRHSAIATTPLALPWTSGSEPGDVGPPGSPVNLTGQIAPGVVTRGQAAGRQRRALTSRIVQPLGQLVPPLRLAPVVHDLNLDRHRQPQLGGDLAYDLGIRARI